jgi:hypothetical protein
MAGKVQYRSWLLRVIGWDGMLPIVAFFTRLVVGHRHIQGLFTPDDYLVFAILYAIYLTAMIVAMYPGRGDLFPGN